MKIFLGSSVAIILSFVVYFFVSTKSPSPENPLTIGMMSGWPPFMSINQTGDYEGFDVDIANEVCARLKRTCTIVDMGALTTLFVALEQNKIDMIFSGLDITKARREKLTMIPYYGEEVRNYALLFWNNIPDGIQTIEDLQQLKNPTVVVEPGDSAERVLDAFAGIQKKQIGSIADQVLELKYQKSLALFREPHVARELMRKNPEMKSLSVPLPEDFQIYGMGIALNQKSVALSQAIEQTIDAMKTDGTMTRIAARWFAKN